MVEAQQVAAELGHEQIGTAHVLVGILTDPDTLAAKVLARWEIDHAVALVELE